MSEPVLPKFLALSAEAQIDALVLAAEPALVAWTTWAVREKPEYTDSVVGMHHVVDIDLPACALEDVRRRHEEPDPSAVQQAYVEPIVAIQDCDWEMPNHLELGYYGIYNLHRLVFEPQDTVTATLVLNQALSGTLVENDDEAIQARIMAWWSAWEKRR